MSSPPVDGSPPGRNRSIVQVPPEGSPHPLLRSLPPATFLPAELLDILNHTYFLHLLATDSAQVLPPGKSILSMMSKPHARQPSTGEIPTLQEKVEEVIHKAFWDEAIESLSSPAPTTQLPRLKHLYNDLHIALTPLLPKDHIILTTLAAPLSPTSAPLLSALVHLREILSALRERCAPLRDAYIDALLARLADPPPSSALPDLAKLIVDTVRDILQLADAMKDDLSQFVMGAMSEAQLRATIRDQARKGERALVLDLWRSTSLKAVVAEWTAQLATPYSGVANAGDRPWIVRLMQALGATTPVACPMPTKPVPTSGDDAEPPPALPNVLPPPFFFSTPELEYIQNLLQALVITASLLALLPSQPPAPPSSNPSPPSPDSSPPPALDFTSRIWTLLTTSIDSESSADDTKLINLADELIRARGGPLDAAEEARLRAAVARTLQVQDPVFVLLQKRLLVAVAARLVAPRAERQGQGIPSMRTGRARPGQNLSLGSQELDVKEESVGAEVWRDFGVKGFEEKVLAGKVREVCARLWTVVGWVESIWEEELRGQR
ncbi:hypothetical protein OF83DRAFT_742947 [Amylostereum chailletii]|nr:hypothetical protein OF83DRAFT_742947 [Amylostereum chailletii]